MKIEHFKNNQSIRQNIFDILNVKDEVFKMSELEDLLDRSKYGIRREVGILKKNGEISAFAINRRSLVYGTHENIKKLEEMIK